MYELKPNYNSQLEQKYILPLNHGKSNKKQGTQNPKRGICIIPQYNESHYIWQPKAHSKEESS